LTKTQHTTELSHLQVGAELCFKRIKKQIVNLLKTRRLILWCRFKRVHGYSSFYKLKFGA